MMKITNWLTGKLIFEADVSSIKICLEMGVKKGIDFSYAKLNGANLNGAKLNGAKLNYAELNGAELNYAKLNGAELNYAELNGAELNDAKLNGAELNYAELNYAELNDAGLNDAELVRIDGFKFNVIITKTHVHIGCKRFTKNQFKKIDLSKLKDDRGCFEQYDMLINIINSIEKYQGEK